MTNNNTANEQSMESVFKLGYTFTVEVYDFDSAAMKADIAKALAEGQEILDRMKLPNIIEEKSIRA